MASIENANREWCNIAWRVLEVKRCHLVRGVDWLVYDVYDDVLKSASSGLSPSLTELWKDGISTHYYHNGPGKLGTTVAYYRI